MPGAQKIAIEYVVKDVEVKVRLSWKECPLLLRLIDLAESMGDHYEANGGTAGEENMAAIRFGHDLRAVVTEAMLGTGNTKEM